MLYVVATPLGNVRDVTLRAMDVLTECDEWVVEDSRRAGKLKQELDLPDKPMNRYYDERERQQTPELIEKLVRGLDLALICDAGTPVISDPGYNLIRGARSEGVEVRPVPGASAPIAALSVSGFPSDEFLYVGYLPEKRKARRDKLLELKHFPTTVVFFEAPHRMEETLGAIRSYLGDRRLFVGREMTKRYEEYREGTAAELLEVFEESGYRGEFTVLLHPPEEESTDPEAFLGDLLKKGMKLSDAARVAARYSGETRSDLYRRGLELQDEGGEDS